MTKRTITFQFTRGAQFDEVVSSLYFAGVVSMSRPDGFRRGKLRFHVLEAARLARFLSESEHNAARQAGKRISDALEACNADLS